MRTLVWFRGKDLRISDHKPLRDAIKGGELITLFVLDPYFFAPNRAGQLPHRMQFLLDGLVALDKNIEAKGGRLILVKGKSIDVVPQLASRWKVDRVVAHRWVEPFGRERDERIAKALECPFELYEGETLLPPGTLRTQAGKPYAVFSQFARSFRQAAEFGKPLAAPKTIPPPPSDVRAKRVSVPTCKSLGLPRNTLLQKGGEAEAQKRLRRFVANAARQYHFDRDRMDLQGTSRLSADIKFGTISIRRVWTAVEQACGRTKGGKTFLNELVWREFAHSTLWGRPQLLKEPFRPAFSEFPWRDDDTLWDAWAHGKTGYPVVDAAARQLLGEGFVHNRARMIAASFLTKHLLIDYKRGEGHYLKYLTDGDWAQNNMGWQWSAGCGCDAQPYFRVFNPITQGEKFDPKGDYVRRWIPELKDVPLKYIHRVWEAPEDVLEEAGVALGKDYPAPIVEHKFARERFLTLAKQTLKTQPG